MALLYVASPDPVAAIFPTIVSLPSPLKRLFSISSPVHVLLGLPMALLDSFRQQPRATFRCVWVSLSCLYIAYMMGWSYYMACMEPPGSASHGLSDSLGERRRGPGSGIWWQQSRERVASAAFLSANVADEDTDGDTSLPYSQSSSFRVSAAKAVPIKSGHSEHHDQHVDLATTFRFCKKCPQVTLTEAMLRLPPELRLVEKRNRRHHLLQAKQQAADDDAQSEHIHSMESTLPPELFTENDDEGEMEIRAWLGDDAQNMVRPPKPERTHHCKACKMCVLKYDHHCPWINQCVGIGNERYFILFMLWFALGTCVLGIAGWPLVKKALWGKEPWNFRFAPRILFIMIYAKAVVMGAVVFVLALWHLYLVSQGETSVESQDNSHYRAMAKERNERFVNVYDMGFIQNLQIFFNVGPGMNYRYYTLFLPLRIEPYSDGWHWAKGSGLAGHHMGIKTEEEFTDDDGA